MNNEQKQLYQDFCKNNPVPIFMQDWYLDAVCDQGTWNVCFSYAKDGRVRAILPYYLSAYQGFRVIKMPRLCPFMGIWLCYPSELPPYKKATWEKLVIYELVEQLPKVNYYFQHYAYTFTNWLPLYWKGFKQTTMYSYRIKKAANEMLQLAQCNRNIRRNIKKAKANLMLHSAISFSDFFHVLSLTFQRQGLKIPFSYDFLENLYQTIQERQQGKIFVARDEKNNIHAVAYLIWDKQSAYYHLAGDQPNFRQSGASILLIWEAIQFTFKELNLDTFDFVGSTIESIEAIRRQFGAIQQAHFRIMKAQNRFLDIMSVLLNKF